MTVKTVAHVRVGFPKDTTILIDLNRLDENSNPTVEVYNTENWNFPAPLHLSIQYQDRQHNLVIKLGSGGLNNLVPNK